MHHIPRRNFASRRTKHSKKPKLPAKFEASGSPICEALITTPVLEEALRLDRSGIKHLEEIKSSGYEMPSVNQIEVLVHTIHYFAAAADLDRPPVFTQIHPFCQQRPIVAYCKEHSIVVQAYCPIIRGRMDHDVIQECARKVPHL